MKRCQTIYVKNQSPQTPSLENLGESGTTYTRLTTTTKRRLVSFKICAPMVPKLSGRSLEERWGSKVPHTCRSPSFLRTPSYSPRPSEWSLPAAMPRSWVEQLYKAKFIARKEAVLSNTELFRSTKRLALHLK